MGLWSAIFGKRPFSGQLTFPDHYMEERQQVGGPPCQLVLGDAQITGPAVGLFYHWQDDLSDEDADRLDSRLRAYVACAIYDAAVQGGLRCVPGPPHGRRPSWRIRGESFLRSLTDGGFDNEQKQCFAEIGPGVAPMEVILSSVQGPISQILADAFRAHFRRIAV